MRTWIVVLSMAFLATAAQASDGGGEGPLMPEYPPCTCLDGAGGGAD